MVPVLPVVTKADTMTVKECVNYRREISTKLQTPQAPISVFMFSQARSRRARAIMMAAAALQQLGMQRTQLWHARHCSCTGGPTRQQRLSSPGAPMSVVHQEHIFLQSPQSEHLRVQETLEACGVSDNAIATVAAIRPPYLVVCSNTNNDEKLKGDEPELWPERRYMWGTSEAMNPQHSDLLLLRRLLLQEGVEEIATSKLSRCARRRISALLVCLRM
jgi:septin family protein